MDALKELSNRDQEAKTKRYPAVPLHCIPRTKFSDKTANGLTKAILSYLTLHGHYCTRISSEGQYDPRLKLWRPGSVKRGIGDVLAFINGKSVMIEVKMKDRQSIWQKRTQAEVESSGGLYLIARSFDQFIEWYKSNTQ